MNDGGFMAVSPINSNIVFATGNVYNAAYFIGVSHTSDGGTTWEHDTTDLGTRGWAVAFDGVDTNRVYVGGDTSYSYPCVLITTDLGATWTASNTGLTGAVNVLLTIPGNGELVYAGTNNGLFRSTDAGATWAVTSLTSQVRTLVADPVHPANVYAGTYGAGVYASTDGGTTWNPMNTGLTCNNVLSLALRPGAENTIYAGTEGGSVFRTTVTTGVAGPSSIVHRSSFIVSPNPCRDLATISFSSSLLSPHSSLSLYDATGSLVRSFTVRTSSFVLRTSDFTPGTYFVRLKSGRETHTSRLTILN
ncbi:MAG: T9SS type A sorting domain-containing protein [candidate division WOR-3 bacterium]|nr:T9SS type A sorting domain-containing protein [candidate division WOR-3 bacterium]